MAKPGHPQLVDALLVKQVNSFKKNVILNIQWNGAYQVMCNKLKHFWPSFKFVAPNLFLLALTFLDQFRFVTPIFFFGIFPQK